MRETRPDFVAQGFRSVVVARRNGKGVRRFFKPGDLPLGEVAGHRHNKARNAFVSVGGEPQPAPAPRFSLTSNDTPSPAPQPGRDTERLLRSLGYSDAEIAELKDAGAVG